VRPPPPRRAAPRHATPRHASASAAAPSPSPPRRRGWYNPSIRAARRVGRL